MRTFPLASLCAIRWSWASATCSAESQLRMRVPLGRKRPVDFDEIVDALRSLESGPLPKWKRVLRRKHSGSNQTPDGELGCLS